MFPLWETAALRHWGSRFVLKSSGVCCVVCQLRHNWVTSWEKVWRSDREDLSKWVCVGEAETSRDVLKGHQANAKSQVGICSSVGQWGTNLVWLHWEEYCSDWPHLMRAHIGYAAMQAREALHFRCCCSARCWLSLFRIERKRKDDHQKNILAYCITEESWERHVWAFPATSPVNSRCLKTIHCVFLSFLFHLVPVLLNFILDVLCTYT